MSPAACAGSPPGPRSESPGTAGLLYAVAAVSTAFVGVQPRRVLGLKTADQKAVFHGALLTDIGTGACGGVVQPSPEVPVGRRVAALGPRRPTSRGETLPTQPGTPSWSGTADHQRPRRTDCRTMH